MIRTRNIEELNLIAARIRHDIVEMIGCRPGKVGHLGGSCSLADIVSALYFYKMKHDPSNPLMEGRDRFILSKGHAALVQYAALVESGYYEREELYKVKELDGCMQGHPDMRKTRGVEANTGSLGQGLSIGLGIAMGLKMDDRPGKVYVAMGDGEQAEGQIWEAALCANKYGVDNLIGILDCNTVQCTSTTEEIMPQINLENRWRDCGWEIIRFDGHNMAEICDALDRADEIKGRPVLLFADTVKGKGVSFAEGNPAFHNGGLTAEQLKQAHEDIDRMLGKEPCND